jgi:hypothetical protein
MTHEERLTLRDLWLMTFPSQFLLQTCKEGRMAHLKGVGKVLQLSGPGRYSAGVSYQLFIGMRPLLVSRSLHR